MPISMKPAIDIVVHVPTATADLVTYGSGANAAGQVATNLEEGDGTGYSNKWTDHTIPAYFTPGVLKKWDRDTAGYQLLGESSLKIAPEYRDLLESADYLTFKSADWDFKFHTEFGAGFGNERITLALFRRR